MFPKIFQRVSQVPTNPHAEPEVKAFDVADLYRGPATVESPQQSELPLDEKLRQAYFWIVNHAIISPFYDVEYNDRPQQVFTFGDTKCPVTIPSGQSYCSFVLLRIEHEIEIENERSNCIVDSERPNQVREFKLRLHGSECHFISRIEGQERSITIA
ncbi:MAG: hypothetical protein ABI614_10810 [Planctomycetota bacterium]